MYAQQAYTRIAGYVYCDKQWRMQLTGYNTNAMTHGRVIWAPDSIVGQNTHNEVWLKKTEPTLQVSTLTHIWCQYRCLLSVRWEARQRRGQNVSRKGERNHFSIVPCLNVWLIILFIGEVTSTFHVPCIYNSEDVARFFPGTSYIGEDPDDILCGLVSFNNDLWLKHQVLTLQPIQPLVDK